MIQQMDSIWWLKLNAILRYLMVHAVSKKLPLYIVNEYPKSGGSWLGEMLGEALEVPFPRNRLPVLASSIMHGHMMHSWNMGNVVVLWRDGRDVVVSHYFHSLFKNEKGNGVLVDKTRAALNFLDYDDIETNLPAFIEYIFDSSQNKVTWSSFADYWMNRKNVVYTSYESLRENPSAELERIIHDLGVDGFSENCSTTIAEKYSFENMSGRKAGSENSKSFLRKGIVGDWKNYFNRESCRVFERVAGRQLIALGYEHCSDWVER